MMTHQIGTKQEVRERTRKALADYLTMFIPGSWKEPLSKLKLLLQANGDVDWEALKGYALMIFDEQRLSEDRVECLASVERLSETFKEIHVFYLQQSGIRQLMISFMLPISGPVRPLFISNEPKLLMNSK
jgi:hypothetical protein